MQKIFPKEKTCIINLLCYLIYVKNMKIHFITSYVLNSNVAHTNYSIRSFFRPKTVDGSVLEETSSFKMLGLTFSSKLD